MKESERQVYRSAMKGAVRVIDACERPAIAKKSAAFRATYWRQISLGLRAVLRKALDDGNNVRKTPAGLPGARKEK